MKAWIQARQLASRLLFPPFCLHCELPLRNGAALFCLGCSGLFELIDPLSRCPFCFIEDEGKRPCLHCIKKAKRIQMASACDSLPPVKTFIKELKKGEHPFLSKTAAAFLTIQYERLGWPVPEGIVPIPPRIKWKGADAIFQIAKMIAKSLRTKLLPILGRRAGDFPASRLPIDLHAQNRSFYLKKPKQVEDKILLLIDDEIVTGETFCRAAEVLKEGFPKRLYALSFARSFDN